MKIRLNNAAATAASLAISALLISVTYASSAADITFPVAELGNCTDKASCYAYCDIPENHAACEAFAEQHNLDRDEHDDKFDVILADGGPGQCAAGATNPHETCRQYCDSMDHMRECVAYAKTHDLMDESELKEAEQVIAALDRGAKLPTGCTDKETCQNLCEAPPNVETARQCFAFAEAAGFLPPDVDREQAEIVFRAIEEGRAPFKTPREFEQCENPPSDEILRKCVDFGLENGFLSAEEAEMVKKTGGKGPGGCRGKMQCEAYCSAHQDECMAFAEEHGLMKPEDKARMQEGKVRFKEAIANAPEEVKQCLEEAVGADTLRQVLAGEKMPNEELGQHMRKCFESQMGGGMMEGEGMQGKMFGDQFPPEVKSCLESKIGANGVKKLLETGHRSSEIEGVMRGCFQEMMQNRQYEEGSADKRMPPQEFQGEFKGPGGCTNPEECKRYCTEHPEKCGMRQGPGGFPQGGSPEEMERMMRERMMEEGREEYMREHEGQFPGGMNPEDMERMREEYEQYRGTESTPGDYQPPENEPEEHMEPPPPEPTSRLPKIPGNSLLANVANIVLTLLGY